MNVPLTTNNEEGDQVGDAERLVLSARPQTLVISTRHTAQRPDKQGGNQHELMDVSLLGVSPISIWTDPRNDPPRAR